MKLPQLSPRRWFWLLLAAAVLWSLAGWRWDADPVRPHFFRRAQSVAAVPIEALELPARFVFSLAQEATTGVIRRLAFVPRTQETGGQSAADIAAENRRLDDENTRAKAMLLDAYAQLAALQHLQKIGISPEHAVPANVISLGAGADDSILTIDKGAKNGDLQTGDAVVAPRDEVTLLGRISRADSVQSDVLLLTNPQVSVQAQIIRPRHLPAGSPAQGVMSDLIVTTQPCLVQGMGNNQMRITDVNIQQGIAPAVGDLVRITDPAWPAETQFMVIGQIDKVSHREDQPLRYELLISPRIAATTLRNVMVLTSK